MKKRLLNFLACPKCQKELNLFILKKEGKEIIEGELTCSFCNKKFPITNGIPRFIFELSKEERKTQKSFGYEWKKFSEMLPIWKENFKWYFEPCLLPQACGQKILNDKTVLEIGCGKGRHTFYAAQFAKEIIAIDFSPAIDVAKQNNKIVENVYFIQADIYHLPFKPELFDFVYSLGVLHHLPTPEKGFKKILIPLKKNGGVLIYLYHNFPKNNWKYWAIKIVNGIRFITTRLSYPLLYFLCYPLAFLIYIIFIIPYKLFKAENKHLPFFLYLKYPFRVLLNDTFDRLSAPIENRYYKEEVISWYKNNNLKVVKILGNGGWRIFGYKV